MLKGGSRQTKRTNSVYKQRGIQVDKKFLRAMENGAVQMVLDGGATRTQTTVCSLKTDRVEFGGK